MKLSVKNESLEKLRGNKEWNPVIPYKHFTDDEITYIYNLKGFNPKSRLVELKKFRNTYPDIKEIENNIESCLFSPGQFVPWWYIKLLLIYGRIKIDISRFLEIIFYRNDFWVIPNSLIDKQFIEEYEKYAIDKLGYCRAIIQNVTNTLFKVSTYYYTPVSEIGPSLFKFAKLVKDISDLEHERVRIAMHIYEMMGFIVQSEKSEIIGTHDTFLLNLHSNIKNPIKIYADYLQQAKSLKYYKTEVSHLRHFFCYLYNYHREIDSLEKINNDIIQSYIKFEQKVLNIRGEFNSAPTVNHRVQSIGKMISYISTKNNCVIPNNIITKYDYIKEPLKYPKYISKDEISKLIHSIKADNEHKDWQKKQALLILIDTGRRISEVLNLSFDCLKGNKLFFNKIKGGKSNQQIVGETTINAIRKLKEYARDIEMHIYSSYDKKSIRRLFPSIYYKGRCILSSDSVSDYFKKIQVANEIVDEKGNALYRLHQNKRNFVACMLAAGVKPEELAKFLGQEIESLVPYEVNNGIATNTLVRVESKGLLMGKSFDDELNEKHCISEEIFNSLKDINVVERHKENLIYSINNSGDTFPLVIGLCTDNASVDICGDLVCMACEQYRCDNIDAFELYALRIYVFILQNKGAENVKKVESQVKSALENVFIKIEDVDKSEFDKIIMSIKKKAKEEVKRVGERKTDA